jgi:hypothetical protein
MPTIEWTADQAEGVRQMILDRMDYLREREEMWRQRGTPTVGGSLAMMQDLRDILTKLEAAYASD